MDDRKPFNQNQLESTDFPRISIIALTWFGTRRPTRRFMGLWNQ